MAATPAVTQQTAARTFMDRLAAAPISWGICEVPGWGVQLPPQRVLGEMRQLGFSRTELGSPGYLPDDPAELRAALAEFDLGLLGAFTPVVIHDPAEADATRAAVAAAADILTATGAPYLISAPVMDWDWAPKAPVDDGGWTHAYAMLDEIEDYCAERGLVQAVHPHLGTLLERAADIERVLENTRAGFTLDTGHMLIGGYDPMDMVRDHFDRITHVHLKDVVLDLCWPVLELEQTIMQGVQAGMFCNLGAGDAPIAQVVGAMHEGGFEGWYVIEQDAAIVGDLPPANAGPKDDIAASVAYLAGLALGEPAPKQPTMEGNSQ